jgi:uncharacterized protein
MENRVFLDTSFAIALSVKSDQHNDYALKLSEQLESERIRLITTTAILLEIGNALSQKRYRQATAELLISLERDQTVEILPITDELYQKAFELFRNRPDKDWGLIDCISFVVMRENGLTEALTTDEHFEQAGFIALLRNYL